MCIRDSVHTEGITKITLEDVAYAENWGGVIKLIGEAKRIPERKQIECMVAPAFVHNESQLANIEDVYKRQILFCLRKRSG